MAPYAGGGRGVQGGTYLPDKRLTIFRNERMTPYTSLASSSKGRPALALEPPPTPTPTEGVDGGGGVPGDWLPASLTAMRTPEVEESVLRGLEKGVPCAEEEPAAEEEEDGRGERACETPGRSAPPSLARFGRLLRCQSW